MGFLSDLLDLSDEYNKKKKDREYEKIEKECDRYGLTKEERQWVHNGDYDADNFEDSENEALDEDDFYHDS